MKHRSFIEAEWVMVFLSGTIYTEDADKMRPELLGYMSQGYSQFLIDMEQVDYLDSAGIAMLIALQKGVSRLGGKVTLRGVNGMVRELFEITHLDEVFEIQ